MDSTENPLRTLINKKNYNIVIFLKNLYFQTIIIKTTNTHEICNYYSWGYTKAGVAWDQLI
jgi:hypothetical protein